MKKILSEISPRTLMAVMVGLLAAIALGFAIIEYRDSRAVYRNAEMMVERNRIADVCLETLNGFLVERDWSLLGLLGQLPVEKTHRQFLDERRLLVDDHLRRFQLLVPASSQAKAGEVKRLWGLLREFRPVLDHEVSLPRSARQSVLYGRWLSLSNDLVTSLLGLMYEMADYPAIEDAGLEYLSNLRVSSILYRTLIGTELTIYNANFPSGRDFSLEEIASVRLLRSQSMVVWERLASGMQRFGDAAALASLEKLRVSLFNELRPSQDNILLAAERGIPDPDVGNGSVLQRHVELSMRVTNSASELTQAIGRLADSYSYTRVEKARSQERLALLGIVATLLLCALAFIVFIGRVARPLRAIQRRIDRLIKKQSGNEHSNQSETAGDEFGRVNLALELLDEAMEARLRSDADLREHERISASILAVVPQAIIAANSGGIVTMFSPGAEVMLGYSAEEIVGRQSALLFHDWAEVESRARELSEELGMPVEPGFQVFIAKAKVTGHPDEREWTYIRKDGSRLTVLLSITVFTDAQGDYGCGVATDITQRSQLAAEMSRLANYDPLTQLPNRRLFHDRIRMAITQARRENTCLALMMIDLDRFKPVNDRYGHSMGDLLLKAVAMRVQGALRESDTLARVGGDEFVVILPMIGGCQDAVGVAEKIRQSLCAPFDLVEGVTVSIDCSIGIAIYPDHGGNEDILLKNADNAMYVAKAMGRAQVHVSSGGGQESGMVRVTPERSGEPAVNLVWRRAYQCGVASIDSEHKALFAHGNTLIRAVANGRMPLEKLPEMLDELIDSVMTHFRNEEFILARHGYSELEHHALQHQKLVERALELRSMAVAGELSLGDVVSFVTRDIVAEHMLIDDHDYFPLLRKNLNHDQAHFQ